MVILMLSVVIGIVLGMFDVLPILAQHADGLSNFGLCLLLFFIGIDIGYSENIIDKLKHMSLKVLLLPYVAIVGSVIGGVVVSYFINLSMEECVAVSASMGWYSLSAIELGQVNSYLGGVTLISNVSRELLSIFFVPLVASKIGSYESVGMCGATAMDTLLPIINKSNPPKISIVGFYSGVTISLIVPILLPILINLFGWG